MLAILLVTGFVFIYQLYELRGTATKGAYRVFRGLSILVVLGAIVWSFFVMGSPKTARDLRFDERRVSDLQNIQYQVINFWQYKHKLPMTLDELADPLSGQIIPTDPASRESYEYRTTSTLGFELCAVFAKTSKEALGGKYPRAAGSVPAMPYGIGGGESNWEHSVGRACFSRTIDPQLYPPITSIKVAPVR